ncbi:MAG: hypothetical protein IAF38_01405 [Bacteroidia bacterium]|nr:hypothetical protein [Bacteroidia bacterium]
MKFVKTTRIATGSLLGAICIFSLYFSPSFEKGRGMEIKIPSCGICCGPPPPPNLNKTTIIISENKRVFFYEGGYGGFDLPPFPPPLTRRNNSRSSTNNSEDEIYLRETKLSMQNGIGDILSFKNKKAEIAVFKLDSLKQAENMADSVYRKKLSSINSKMSAATFFIKADERAKYGDVVKMIDLLRLKKISKFSMEEITGQELKALNKVLKKS